MVLSTKTASSVEITMAAESVRVQTNESSFNKEHLTYKRLAGECLKSGV